MSLVDAAERGPEANVLEDGDVVNVPKKVPKPVYVMGLVKNRGEYKMPVNRDLHVLEAISMAGGRTMQIADKVLVRRQLPDEEEPVVQGGSIHRPYFCSRR